MTGSAGSGKVDAHLEIIRPAGRGGQGSVVVAMDTATGELVSVKTLSGAATGLPDEAHPPSIAAHPNIARPRTRDVRGDDIVIVADWVEGTDLAGVLRRGGHATPATVLSWLADAADALWHLHTQVPPVVHGDVKPSNLVLRPDGRVVVIDLAGAAHPSAAAGTRGYQAPELVHAPSAQADVYSLAATATVLLGGHVGEGAPRFERLAPAVAGAVRRVLARGLATDPVRRQRSVHALIAELRRALEAAESTDRAPSGRLSPLVGRQRELTAIEELLTEHRLVTLVGPGGAGKTRLAREAAGLLAAGYADGAAIVDLVPASGRAQVVEALATAVGMTGSMHADLLDAVAGLLRSHSMLLVLDNCEHVVGAVQAVADDLLARCPRLTLLATSRQPLDAREEVRLPVPPLAVPVESQRGRGIAQAESVRLFLALARPAAPDLASDLQAIETVGRIVRQLDGIPLGIELAAAQLGSRDLAAIEAGVADRPSAASDTMERHGSLEAAIAWSYDLLSPQQQALFERCSIFVGGWTKQAARTVVGFEDVDTLHGDLATRSLIVQASPDRFTMLQTVQSFARRRLAGSVEAQATRVRHLAWIERLTHRSGGPFTPSSTAWLDALDDERPNVRAAIATALELDPSRALRLVTALLPLWSERGRISEGQRWLSTCLERATEAAPAERAWARFALGVLLSYDDVAGSCEVLTDVLETMRGTGDRGGEAAAGLALAGPLLNSGRAAAARHLIDTALAHYRRTADAHGFCRAGEHLARWQNEVGDWGSVTALEEEVLPLLRTLDRAPLTCALPAQIARGALYRGDLRRARRAGIEAQQLARDKGGPLDVAFASFVMAEIHARAADPHASAACAMTAADETGRHGERVLFLAAGRLVCAAAALLGRRQEAAVLNAALEATHERLGMGFITTTTFDRWIQQTIRAPLELQQLAACEAAGAQLELDEVTDRLHALASALHAEAPETPSPSRRG